MTFCEIKNINKPFKHDKQILLSSPSCLNENNFTQHNIIKQRHHSSSKFSYIMIIFMIAFCLNIQPVQSFNLAITSNQTFTGVSSIYYFSISNHTNPTSLIFTFSDWSPTQAQPFLSTYMVAQNSTGNALSCIRQISKSIQCNITSTIFPGSVYPSTIVLKISNIFNPSSLKPYSISLLLSNSGGPISRTATLTVTQPRVSSLIIDNYSYEVGKKSSALVYLTFRNYLSSTSLLNITYNTALTTIDMIADSSYTVTTDSSGLKRLTNWDSPSQSFRIIKMNITNPNWAVPFTIDAIQYFIQGGVQYQIEKYTITVQVVPISYAAINTVSPQNLINIGTNDNTLSFSSKCQIAALNGPSKNAYYLFTYDNTIINLNTGSTCTSVSGSTNTCTINLQSNAANATNNFLLSKIKSLIPSNSLVSTLSLKIQTWSYFTTLSQFYTTCSSTLNIDILPQTLNPITTLTSCNQVVGQSNTLTVQLNVDNAAISDVIMLKSYPGKIINKTGSMSFTLNSSTSNYEGAISSTQIINSSRIQFTVSFTNPTYLPSQQPSIGINIYRKLTSNNRSYNIYGQTTTNLKLCAVTSVLSNSTNNILSISNSSTYKSNVGYSIQLSSTSIQFDDYVLNDYVILNFRNKITDGTNFAQTDSPFQLYPFVSNNSNPIVIINSQYTLLSQITSPSQLKITLNSSAVVNLFNDPNLSSMLLTVKQVSNPFFISNVFCSIKTYTSTNFQKQTITTNLVPITVSQNNQLSVSTASPITLLSNNSINLSVASFSKKFILSTSYSYITSIYVIVKTPFSCLNTNSSNQLTFNLPSLNTSDFTITLTNCTVNYFNDYTLSFQVTQYAKFSHANLTQNIKTANSIYPIKSTCGDQCFTCDSSALSCNGCFNSTYSTFNFYSSIDKKCYQSCPVGTYNVSQFCLSCHPICSSCTSKAYNSCTKCAQNYKKNEYDVCQSTCGKNMYISNGQCKSCHHNCEGCLGQNSCYNCKQGAVLVGGQCVFSVCASPCQTCEKSETFCLSCVSNSAHQYYFYQNSCLHDCPEQTFKWQQSSNSLNPRICMKVQSSTIYFPGIILSVIALGIGIGIRCCSKKRSKTANMIMDEKQSFIRKSKLSNKLNDSYKPNPNNLNKAQINNLQSQNIVQNIIKKHSQDKTNPKYKFYKLNLLRWMTVLMGYIQVVCAVVILIQGNIYNPKGVNQLIAAGLAGLVITNLIFGIKFYFSFYRKLSQKRQKFIQTNLKRKINQKIQIQPQPYKQPVAQQKSDQNQQQNENNQNQQPNQIRQTVPNIKHIKNNSKIDENKQNKNNLDSQKSSITQQNSQLKQKYKQNKAFLFQFDNQMLKEMFIGIFSTIFTLRTYNVLRSNLFRIISTQNIQSQKINNQTEVLKLSKSPREGDYSNLALNLPKRNNQVIDLNKTQIIGSKRTSPMKSNLKQPNFNVIKIQSKTSKVQNNIKNSQRTDIKKTQSQILMTSFRPFNIPKQPVNPLLQIKQEYANKFLHPFYTYILFASLILVSLLFAVASAILIFKNRYQNMMIWGIDALVVIVISFLMNIFDLWKAVNLAKHQQHSQLSSATNQINQTMENLKNLDQENDNGILQELKVQQNNVNQLNATKKISPVKKYSNSKVSPSKIKLSQMKGSIKQDQIEIDAFSKIKSPKSPSQRSEKTKTFGSKNKSPSKSFGNLQIKQEKPPQLKIFDDLEDDENKVTKFSKPQKIPKQGSKKGQSTRYRSSNRTLYGRKTQISNQLLSQTTRGKKQKGHKLDDIYLGFMQNGQKDVQNFGEQNRSYEEQQDDVQTVKMDNHDILKSIKQSSVININTEDQYAEYETRKKPIVTKQSQKKIQQQKQPSNEMNEEEQ